MGSQGLLLPKNLRSALQRTPLYRASSGADSSSNVPTATGAGSGKTSTRGSPAALDVLRGKTAGASARDRRAYGEEGYAEEVDVDVVDASSSRHYADSQVFASTSSGVLGPPKKTALKPTASPRSGYTLCRFSLRFAYILVLRMAWIIYRYQGSTIEPVRRPG